jgi:hypothetical protein
MKKSAMLFMIVGLLILSTAGCEIKSPASDPENKNNEITQHTIIDYADVFTLEGIHYSGSYDQVITDEKIIGKEFGSIKFTIADSNVGVNYESKDGDATFLKAGTKVYSLKGHDKKDFAAAQRDGKWILYKAMSQNTSNTNPSGNGITDETYKATALVVEKTENSQSVRITDKEKIKKVLDGIKNGVSTNDSISYPQGNMSTFYFVIPDKEGIGQIVYRYYLNFQDINLQGYIRRFNDTYKVDSSINKIIAESFGATSTIYDSKLGGKQQIYDIYASGKFILRKVVKETPAEKFIINNLTEGEEIWQNGNKVKDTLNGKYKVEIFMKDTKWQDKILNIITSKQYKLPGVIDISYSAADEGNSSVLYLCYEEKPDLYIDESADSFVLFNKK